MIRIGRHKAREIEVEHPAVFPVALAEHVIAAFTSERQTVYEPFGGSGTGIVAAETQGRRCRAIELAPAYVDVAVRRWNALFPAQPACLEGGAGFAATAAARGVSIATP